MLKCLLVALRLECVDRNLMHKKRLDKLSVALRLECVDRNIKQYHLKAPVAVALRLECVDRNSTDDCIRVAEVCRTPFGVRG